MTTTMTDLFAGIGGSSTGAEQVPGVEVVEAANHWDWAIAVHNENHPETEHYQVDLHQDDPRHFSTTDLLWASPECTKWSQAGGSQPKPAIEEGLFEDPLSSDAATRSRLLMFDVLKFIEYHRYRYAIVENVVDIATQTQYRLAWHEWKRQLRELGYHFRVVSLNSMHAQAFGPPAPQSRDRIYVVAWRDGERAPNLDRILRPKAYCPRCETVIGAQQSWKNGRTVGRYRQAYVFTHTVCGTVVEPGWLPASSAIDWSIPGERIGDRLKPKTRLRIAAGIARYWGPLHIEAEGNQYDAADPKHSNHADPNAYYRAWPVADPLKTLHTANTKALVVPVEGRDGKDAAHAGEPFRTQTTRLESALAVPAGGTWNQDALPLSEPLRTVTTRETTGLARPPFISEMYGTGTARPVTDPASTFTAGGNHHFLAQAEPLVMTNNHHNRARPVSEPQPTFTTATGGGSGLMTPYYGTAREAKPVDGPMGTLTTVDRYALVHRHNTGGAEMTTPIFEELRTLTTAGHQSLLRQPRPRITPTDLEHALQLVPEVLFRMFRPHEVTAGMAFPAGYLMDTPYPRGHKRAGHAPSARDKVKGAGNAVTPPASRDLVACVVEAMTGEAVAA